MKVLYELDLNDIIRIVSEKYGVPQEKVKKTNKDGLNYLMIDMSETETPGPVPFKDYVSPFLAGKKEEPAQEKKEPEKQDIIPTEVVSDEVYQELQYKKITNEMLQALIMGGLTIPQICEKYDLKDSKYSARLYKRAEQFRKEGARLGRKRNKEKAEDTEPTAG